MTWNSFGAMTQRSHSKPGSLTQSPYLEHLRKAGGELMNRIVIIPDTQLQRTLVKGLREIQVDELGISVKQAMEFVYDAQLRSLQNAGDPGSAFQEAVADTVWEFFAGYEESYDADSGMIHLAINHARGNGGLSIIELDHRANQLIYLLQEQTDLYCKHYREYIARWIHEYPEYVITAEFVRFLHGGYAVYVGEPKW